MKLDGWVSGTEARQSHVEAEAGEQNEDGTGIPR